MQLHIDTRMIRNQGRRAYRASVLDRDSLEEIYTTPRSYPTAQDASDVAWDWVQENYPFASVTTED